MDISAKKSVSEKTETKTQRTEYEDGSYEEVRVEKVEGGYIKTICKHFKENGEWQWTDTKSVSLTDPFDSLSLAEKLKEVMKGD
jgi:hypothetical protein